MSWAQTSHQQTIDIAIGNNYFQNFKPIAKNIANHCKITFEIVAIVKSWRFLIP